MSIMFDLRVCRLSHGGDTMISPIRMANPTKARPHPVDPPLGGRPSEIEFFLAHAPDPTPIPELIAVAGMRWKIEENNGQGKDLLGLDQYQVRKWTPWTGT